MSNTTAIPAEIQNVLEELNGLRGQDWSHIYACANDREQALTRSLCYESDFILVHEGECFLFSADMTGWSVISAGQPIYWVDPEKYDIDDFGSFFEELKHELAGVDLRIGSDSNNQGSRFFEVFDLAIEDAVSTALKYA